MIHWSSIDSIRNIKVPTLFISGRADRLINPEMMDRLYQAAEKSTFKRMYKVETGEHNDTWIKGGEDYFEEFDDFIQKCVKGITQ